MYKTNTIANIKILFWGDTMFGRNNNDFITNPFVNIEHIIKNVDVIIFNLETTISEIPLDDSYKDNKVFNYQSNGEQLIKLKQLTNIPIFVSIANNHSLDYSEKGYYNTQKFLSHWKYLYTNDDKAVYKDNIAFFNASDHCGCQDINKWSKHIWIIQNTPNMDNIKKMKNLGYTIIFSIHWDSNWLINITTHMKELGRYLIDNGVDIVFGHSAHHIPSIPYEYYNNGLIIYGLGDLINDYSIRNEYNSDEALMLIVQNKKVIKEYNIKRKFVNNSSIPTIQ